jgi:acyl-CoA thioester hydrolase
LSGTAPFSAGFIHLRENTQRTTSDEPVAKRCAKTRTSRPAERAQQFCKRPQCQRFKAAGWRSFQAIAAGAHPETKDDTPLWEPHMNDPSNKKIITRARAQVESPVVSYHITRLRVPLFEVDMGQAVYHGNYYHLFELARTDMLRKTGFTYRELVNRQLHLSIVESRCKYRKALRYDDEIEIHTGITALGSRGLSFSQLIYRLAEDRPARRTKSRPELELCTEAELDMLCVSVSGQVTLLPDDFRLAVETLVDKPAKV